MPPSPCVVRAAADTDFAEITSIYSHYVLRGTATFELEAPNITTMLERRTAVLALGLHFLAAELQGKIVGFAYASAYRPRPAYRFTIEDSIYIDAGHTGRGCGRALLGGTHRSLLPRTLAADDCGDWRQYESALGSSARTLRIRPCGYSARRWFQVLEVGGDGIDAEVAWGSPRTAMLG